MIASDKQFGIKYDDLSNRELGLRIKNQDREAIAEVDRRFGMAGCRLAFRLIGNETDAQDIWQETLLRLFLKGGQYDESRSSPRPWIMEIVKNTSIDFYKKSRKHKNRRVYPTAKEMDGFDILNIQTSKGEDVSRTIQREEVTNQILKYLDKIGYKSYEVMYLIDVLGLSYSRAASLLGVPIGTIKSSLYRERSLVGDFLNKSGVECCSRSRKLRDYGNAKSLLESKASDQS